MTDDLTAHLPSSGEIRASANPERWLGATIPRRLNRLADLMDQGWRLTPPPQPGTARKVHPAGLAAHPFIPDTHGREGQCNVCEGVDPQLVPQPGTVTELDLIVFLEWLDSTRQVTEWGDPNATHEDTARAYLAQASPSGNVTVNTDDLRKLLSTFDSPFEPSVLLQARNRLAAALADADRDS